MALDQLKVIVELHHEEHYAQRHSRELAGMPVVVFLVKLNFLHFNWLQFWPVCPRVKDNILECSHKTAHVLFRIFFFF